MKMLLLLGLWAGLGTAGTVIEGVDFKDSLEVAKSKLILNGAALRTATIFKVKVYAIGLYTAAKSSDPAEIVAAKTPKLVRMKFLRDVDGKDIQESWNKAPAPVPSLFTMNFGNRT